MPRVKQRGNGQGTALKIKAGNWKAIAVIGYQDGKPIRRTKSGFATKTEALAYIPTLKRAKKEQRAPVRLVEAYNEWCKTASCSQSTMWCYQAGFKLFEELNNVPLAELEIDELQECLDSSGKGKRTRQNAKVILGLIYKWAIPRGYISNNLNLAQFLKVGDGDSSHRESFTDEQLKIIKKNIGTIPYADIIYCHCYLGFRPTALLQLKISNYNPNEHYLVGGIKTDAGKNRTVTISPKIQPYIDRLVSQGREYIFSTTGKQISLKVYREAFYNAMELLGFQKPGEHRYSPHTCRHTFATLMKRIDAPDKDKLSLIGHTDSSMLRYYQDVCLQDLRKITDSL